MNKMARVAGALFLVSTGAFMTGNGILGPILDRADILTGVYSERTNVIAGVFLELINALAVLGIAMLLYPILKKHNETLAWGYAASRIMESGLLILSLTSPLLLIALSNDYIAAGASGGSYFQTIANVMAEARGKLFEMAMIVLSLGSLLFCYLLYKSRLVPQFMSVIGFLGYAALFTSSCLAIAGRDMGPVLYIPGAVFEIILPIWLIVKGINLREVE
ncbi:DUF4386 domain-containing protein [Paenibacillus gansuensis]|uniref:DUF4386 domain-containing protein n=1 Tax=Paenibacillus gansuensis TaxID=306542 RepID=A0ABW5PDA0_9BACL